MSGGLTNTGFIAETQPEIVADINAQVLDTVDPGLDLSPDQPIGQFLGIIAQKIAEVWELGATIYNAINPNAAEGAQLVNVSAISGTKPQAATYSRVTVNVTLNAGVTIPAGAVMSVANQPNNRWQTIVSTTNSTPGTITTPVTFQSMTPGPFVANAGTLTVIETPVIGWTGATNPADAIAGLAADTDATLRVKREEELAASGSGTIDAIRAALLQVTGVIQAFVFENTGLTTDANGVPGKTDHAIIWDGAGLSASNTAVAQAIWENKPSGIAMYGATTGIATDSQGNPQVMSFDRATQVPLYVTLTTTPSSLTSAQTSAIKAALVAYGAAGFNLGVSVVALALRAQALVSPVTDVPTFFLGTAPSPGGTANIPISALQIATLSSTNILVNGV